MDHVPVYLNYLFGIVSEGAEDKYDSDWPSDYIHYWYEGSPFDNKLPDGGYMDNESTAYRRILTPRNPRQNSYVRSHSVSS